MLDYVSALVVAGLLAAALWFGWRRLTGRSRSKLGGGLRVLAVVLVAVVTTGWAAWSISNSRTLQLAGRLVNHVETSKKVVALAFDDGPTPAYTDEVLATLGRHHARATFFVIGAQAEEAEQSLRSLVLAGHEIGNHTWNHPQLLGLSAAELDAQLTRTDAVITASGYRGAITVRPPYGKKLLAAPLYLAQHDRTTVMWSLEPDSIAAIAEDSEAMRGYVNERVRPGDIILMHVMYDQRDASRQALDGILTDLAAKGYEFVTVSELLALADR